MESSLELEPVEKVCLIQQEIILAASVGGKEGRGADESDMLGYIKGPVGGEMIQDRAGRRRRQRRSCSALCF